jgi:hypothetical protein
MADEATATEVRLLRNSTEKGFEGVNARLDAINGTVATHTTNIAVIEERMVTKDDCLRAREAAGKPLKTFGWYVLGGAAVYLLFEFAPKLVTHLVVGG